MAEALCYEYVLGNADLPIAKHRAEIEAAISENPVTILVAPTGSGKTTQVPQIAREMAEDGYPLFDEIIVTQPRIVAARSVSERVAEEIAEANQGDTVGYYTSKEGTDSPQRFQDIAFLTDGKAAAQLLHQGKRPNPTTKRLLVIDEVHEWNLNVEQLIAIATEKTDPNSASYDPNLKVVIMSATMDSKGLQKHFAHVTAPLIKVEVPTYEVIRTTSDDPVAKVALNLATRTGGKVLTFVAGKGEIERVITQVAERQPDLAKAIPVIPLHGQQTAEEQNLAFLDYPRGAIVATTNAAETSLTVPGAVAVADSGEVRIDRVRYDIAPGGSDGLYLEDTSQANLDQRAGRVGRTGPGEYVLCAPSYKTPTVPRKERSEYATPSMERSRLDGLLLRLKATDHEIGDFRFFHKPPKEAVKAAETRLFTLGAIDEDGLITERGRQMEKLPLDPEYACMIAFANEKGYSDDVKQNILDIAAIMQLGGIFSRSPYNQRWRELLAKDDSDEVKEADSDLIAQLEAYARLVNDIDPSSWANFDVNEYATGRVEQGRASLADKLDVELHHLTPVEPDNRQAVLTCINAGQLNQIWQRNGKNWSLVIGRSGEYEQSGSSLVGGLGELATGALFSLGLRDDVLHDVQHMNRVLSKKVLEQAAAHMIRDVVDPSSARYDPEQQQLVATVSRMLGEFVVSSFQQIVEIDHDSPEAELIRQGHREHAWNSWQGRAKVSRITYDLEAVAEAIEAPESAQYGVDPITGEPLLAYRGGHGRWCQSREVAVASLEACQARLARAPVKAEQRAIKAAIATASTGLVALKNRGQSAEAAKKLLGQKKMSKSGQGGEWLIAAEELLESAKAA